MEMQLGLTPSDAATLVSCMQGDGKLLLTVMRALSDRDTLGLRDRSLDIEDVRYLQGAVAMLHELAGILETGLADWLAEGDTTEAE